MESTKKYHLVVKKKVDKFLMSLSNPFYETIKNAMLALADDPRPYGCKKLSGEDAYRIRVGDYRIVYSIYDDIVTVEVIRINHRKEVYKKKK
jgi:addiction module toxin, relE/stbE family